MFMEVKNKMARKTNIIQEKTVLNNESQNPTREDSYGSRKPATGSAINSKYVRVREAPSSKAAVVTFMAEGDTADILGARLNYYKIRVHKTNEVGYISSEYFKEEG